MTVKVKKVFLLFLLFSLFFTTACSSKEEANSENGPTVNQTEAKTVAEATEVATEQPAEIPTEEATEEIKHINLSNEYSTRFGEVNAVTYPKFTFNYPDNWSVSQEEVAADREIVILQNDNRSEVVFSNFHFAKDFNFSSSHTVMGRVEISKVEESQFTPSYVQSTDYSHLGDFMVAKLKTTGTMNMQTDSDFEDVDGDVSYAVLPITEDKTTANATGPYEGEFSFWYAGHTSFIGRGNGKDFTNTEQQEVIAILNSFRVAQ